MDMLKQSLRMTLRDWRAGELRFVLVALVVAVSALSAVGFFIDRMGAGMARDARQLMGADLLVNADSPIAPGWRSEAQRRGLLLADTVTFQSMAQAGEGEQSVSQLASVKAVSGTYPLRGQVKVGTDPAQVSKGFGEPTADVPPRGSVWVDPPVLDALGVKVGDSIRLGDSSFRIDRLIATEPDRGASFANFAPRVMLPLADLAGTGLMDFGARATYRMQVAARDPNRVEGVLAYERWLRETIATQQVRGVRIESLEASRPEMQATLERSDRFLSLVGLLTALLAAVAVAMAARRFMLRHVDACAMLRCLGMSQGQVSTMYLIEFLLVGLAGSAVGVLVGFGAHFMLAQTLARLVGAALPPVSWVPALQGLATGMVLLAGFALPPVLQLRNVPHNRVIRREQEPPKPAALATYTLGVAAFGLLLLWQAGDLQLSLLVAGAFLGGFALFALVAWLGLLSLRRLRNLSSSQGWRFAITSLQRRPGATVVQTVALTLGLMALLVLTVVRSDLMASWRRATPADAPNRFVINILPEQEQPAQQAIARAGVKDAVLFPMIRGRLVAVNGAAVTGDTYKDDRARRLAEREFNISTMAAMPETNEIVAGAWYRDVEGRPEASVEEGIAKTLGWKLGDRLRFDMAGLPVEATITSIRKLEWGSMRANFFVIINPKAMRDAPRTYMTAFHLPAGAENLSNVLTREFPNVTVIDVSSIIRQVQGVLDQVVQAVEFLFAFTLSAGVLVLYAALMGGVDERKREAGLLRALGATRRQLSQAQWIEFSLVGSLAGLLAAAGATALGWALATYQFKFEWMFSPNAWIAGVLAGAVCAVTGGWIGLRQVLRQPPMQTLREA